MNCRYKKSEIPDIQGLYYFPGFLDDNEQFEAVKHIDVNQWRHDLERRVQHYGWRYGFGGDGGSGAGARCEVDRITKLARDGIPGRQYICSESGVSPYAGSSTRKPA